MASETIGEKIGSAPDQDQQLEKGLSHFVTGFSEEECTQTYLFKETFKNQAENALIKDIFKIDLTDPKLWINKVAIKDMIEGGQAWFPIACYAEMTDLKVVQIDEVSNTQIYKDVGGLTIKVLKNDDSRAFITNHYCVTKPGDKDTDEFKKLQSARKASDELRYTSGFLPTVHIGNLHNGRVRSFGPKRSEVKLPFWKNSSQWVEQYLEPEKVNQVIAWENDTRMLRHLYELTDPHLQEIKMFFRDGTRSDVIENGFYHFPITLKNRKIATLKANVTYPFDYRTGVTTLDPQCIFAHKEDLERDTAGEKDVITWPHEKGLMFANVPSASTTVPTGSYGEVPVPPYGAGLSSGYSYIPCNVPHTSYNGRNHQHPYFKNTKDLANIMPEVYAQDVYINNSKMAMMDPENTKRFWPNEAPFIGDKTIKPLYFYFAPRSNGVAEGTQAVPKDRIFMVEGKLKIKYKIGVYHIQNACNNQAKDLLNAKPEKYDINRTWFADPIFEYVNVYDIFTDQRKIRPSGINRMYISKPIVHAYDMTAPASLQECPVSEIDLNKDRREHVDLDEIGEPARKKIKM